MDSKMKRTDTFNYILTFIAVVVLVGSFATQLITGTQPLVYLDSLAGSFLIGIFLVLYLTWFIYDTSATTQISFKEAALINLKSNPASWCIYAFWIVFIFIPALLNALQ